MEYDKDFIFKKLKKRVENIKPKKIVEPKNKSGKNKKIIIGGELPTDFFSTPLSGTISFDDYSNDNIPLRAKFINIRDYE